MKSPTLNLKIRDWIEFLFFRSTWKFILL